MQVIVRLISDAGSVIFDETIKVQSMDVNNPVAALLKELLSMQVATLRDRFENRYYPVVNTIG